MRQTLLLLALFLLLLVQPAAAQTEVTELDQLVVELWPDYDRPAMLVLLTGTLPASATLPATVFVPLPADADLFAIARFTDDDVLISDVESSAADGGLTLTTPGRTFRVEYYVPYSREGNTTSYRFEWVSDLDVGAASAVVQQPIAATEFTIVPAPEGNAADRGDGLAYHQIAARPLAAGERFTVEVTYVVASPLLSAPPASTPAATATTAPSGGGFLDGLSPWWLLAIPLAAALLGAAWYLGRQAGSGRRRKPRPARAAKANAAQNSAAAGFCHHCGQPAQPGDVFCRQCGTRLKQ